MLLDELARRKIPGFLPDSAEEWPARRAALLRCLLREEYGSPPPEPTGMEAEIQRRDERFCAGRAEMIEATLHCALPQGRFSFPVKAVLPRAARPTPALVYIAFNGNVPGKYLPAEEIVDRGVAIVTFDYQTVATDGPDAFTSKLPALLYPNGRSETDGGTIALWAWAASRALDWALTLLQVDPQRVAVAGHSRLGKTALLAAALDMRFAVAYANESGCSGAAISRGKDGESVGEIFTRFPYWFCERYARYAGAADQLPFDQDALLALCAPRRVYVSSAEEDHWADPFSEYLACFSAGRAWSLLGLPGWIGANRRPMAGDVFHEGSVGYHLRSGTHYLSREDWNKFLDFFCQKGVT